MAVGLLRRARDGLLHLGQAAHPGDGTGRRGRLLSGVSVAIQEASGRPAVGISSGLKRLLHPGVIHRNGRAPAGLDRAVRMVFRPESFGARPLAGLGRRRGRDWPGLSGERERTVLVAGVGTRNYHRQQAEPESVPQVSVIPPSGHPYRVTTIHLQHRSLWRTGAHRQHLCDMAG